uniref:Uncharacterized protein n=1 Tax=Anguilla anguilla TaxID=7936 RepID=A0A0E9SSN7_ANGAN
MGFAVADLLSHCLLLLILSFCLPCSHPQVPM